MATISTIAVPTPFDIGDVNCYVLDDDGAVTVVDPGPRYEEAYSALRAGLERVGREVSDVERILLTHPHIDHFGLGARLREETGARVAIHEDGAPIVENYEAYFLDERGHFQEVFVEHGMPPDEARHVGEIPEDFDSVLTSVPVDEHLDVGDVVDSGVQLECLAAPGHARGSLSFLASERNLLFVGDHVLKHVTPNPILQKPMGGSRPKPLPRYLESLRELADAAVVGLPGHGCLIPDLRVRIQEILDHHEQRSQQFLESLDGEPRTAYELLHEMFPGIEHDAYFLGMSEVFGHLDVLYEEDQVQEIESDMIRYERTD